MLSYRESPVTAGRKLSYQRYRVNTNYETGLWSGFFRFTKVQKSFHIDLFRSAGGFLIDFIIGCLPCQHSLKSYNLLIIN